VKIRSQEKSIKMKTLKLFAIGMVVFLATAGNAQVSVNLAIGAPPPWGPVGFSEARYYYLPDVEAYYDVPSSMFIYYSGGAWIHRPHLPGRFRNYDLYGGYKVVMNDYRGETPYTHFNDYKRQYARGYHGEAQRTIGERPGVRPPGPGMRHEGNPGNKEGGPGMHKDNSHGDRNMREGHGKGGGRGKKK
jgi:hypothetical protein